MTIVNGQVPAKEQVEQASCWHIYVLRTCAGHLYTGITTDVTRRLAQHVAGRGAKNLRGKGPLRLEFSAPAGDRSRASRLEARIKALSRERKEALLAGDLDLDSLLTQAG